MNNKLLTLKTQYKTYTVSLELDTYSFNDRIAVLLIGWNNKQSFPLATVTVNIIDEDITDADCNFVDVNNLPYICSFLEENNLAKPTHNLSVSGYCIYPEYKFNLEEKKSMLCKKETLI